MYNTSEFWGGIVWIVSAISLTIYAIAGLIGVDVPGVEELVLFAENSIGFYIVLAAFITIFIEGLYFIGSFFPGSSLVIILAILAQTVSLPIFLATAIAIYLGWSMAGVFNIYGSFWYRKKFQKLVVDNSYKITDKPWVTWFPAFRANYEVAQVIEGADPRKVLISALRVRLISGIGTTLLVIVIPFILDINTIDNEEGFHSLFLIALITFTIGVWKIKHIKHEVA